jgi:hypothetical protein
MLVEKKPQKIPPPDPAEKPKTVPIETDGRKTNIGFVLALGKKGKGQNKVTRGGVPVGEGGEPLYHGVKPLGEQIGSFLGLRQLDPSII